MNYKTITKKKPRLLHGKGRCLIFLFLILLFTLNYFIPSLVQRPLFWLMYSHQNYPLLINTTTCKIPDFPLYDSYTRRIFMSPPLPKNCDSDGKFWSRVQTDCDESRVSILPQIPVEEWRFVACGYKVITRAGQSAGLERDWQVNVSPLISISREDWSGFNPKAEFIQVECNHTHSQQIEYHAIPNLANNPRRKGIQNKLDFWKNHKEEEELPPNILFIGQDSVTRLNFRRHGKAMVNFLESLGAHEMKGYVKVGSNTFPNVVPLLSGYSLPDYLSACLGNWSTDFQDSCPLIFSKLDQLHYITTFLEDSPVFAIFHYEKRGFFEDPVDFNPRPLELNAENIGPSCIGSPEFLLSYLEKIISFAHNKAPLFGFYFFTHETHDDISGLEHSDEIYAKFLARLDLSNTILFILGDHGVRFGDVSQLILSQFEGNLPNLWIRLGEKVKKKWPEWEESLKVNELRIISPHNLYPTINQILDSYTQSPIPLELAVEMESKTPIPRKHFVSVFEPQKEDANCTDIGAPLAFCPCGGLDFLLDGPSISATAAAFAMNEINSLLNTFPCEILEIEKVQGGAFMNEKKSMLVMFTTKPGNAEVQATVELEDERPVKLLVADRLNRIDKSLVASCARKLTPWSELFCVCK